jgi:hypothetical protein
MILELAQCQLGLQPTKSANLARITLILYPLFYPPAHLHLTAMHQGNTIRHADMGRTPVTATTLPTAGRNPTKSAFMEVGISVHRSNMKIELNPKIGESFTGKTVKGFPLKFIIQGFLSDGVSVTTTKNTTMTIPYSTWEAMVKENRLHRTVKTRDFGD